MSRSFTIGLVFAFASIIVFGVAIVSVLAADNPQPEAPHSADLQTELDKDLIFKALCDEMTRSYSRLAAPGHARPYFIDYCMYENDDFSVEATLGTLAARSRRRSRVLLPTVRVGSYEMDNSNFRSDASSSNFSEIEDFAPIDDDYLAIRRSLWLMTDARYKMAVETLEEKKAYLLEKSISDTTPDFSKEKPFNYLLPTEKLTLDEESWSQVTRRLSDVFRQYPRVYNSWVRYDERVTNTWLANSEGTRVRYPERACRFLICASIRTADGMAYSDHLPFVTRKRDRLAAIEEMETAAKEMAERLEKVADARPFDYFEGPVLFEGQASAEFFAQVLAPNLKVVRMQSNEAIFDAASSNPLASKLGRRVLPTFLSVTDDPLCKFHDGVELCGFEVDEQGVPAQRVKLIEDGFLKNLLSGRTPTQKVSRSNGHGVSFDSSDLAKNSTLFIESSSSRSKEELVELMRKLASESGLDHYYVVRRVSNKVRDDDSGEMEQFQLSLPGAINMSRPLLLYKVSSKDGREELVRGARFNPMNLRTLKDIVAAGDDSHAHVVEGSLNDYFHVITPSIVVQDVEIEKLSADKVKPPVIPSPLMESNGSLEKGLSN